MKYLRRFRNARRAVWRLPSCAGQRTTFTIAPLSAGTFLRKHAQDPHPGR